MNTFFDRITGWNRLRPLASVDNPSSVLFVHPMAKFAALPISALFARGALPLCFVFTTAFSCIGAETSTPRLKTIVVLGDSLAAGHGLDPSESFPSRLQESVRSSGLDFKVVNASVSGDTSAGGLRRIGWLLKQQVDVLVLELGGNDGLRGIAVEATRTNLQAIIDRVKEKNRGVRVVIAGMQMPPNMGEVYNNSFRTLYTALAMTNNAALVPFLLEGVGGKPELNQADGIHPTTEGQRILADNVWKILKPILVEIQNKRTS